MPPLPIVKLPVSFQVATAWLVSGRLSALLAVPLISNPPDAIVAPTPLIAPPVQLSGPLTVIVLEPERVPPESVKLVALTATPLLLTFAVPPLMLSAPMLTRLPVKFAVPPFTVVVPVTLYVPARLAVP